MITTRPQSTCEDRPRAVKESGYDRLAMASIGRPAASRRHEQQSPTRQGVEAKGRLHQDDQGAGDQGMMFGTPATTPKSERCRSPRPRLTKRLEIGAQEGLLDFLRPAAKSRSPGVRERQAVAIEQSSVLDQHTRRGKTSPQKRRSST